MVETNGRWETEDEEDDEKGGWDGEEGGECACIGCNPSSHHCIRCALCSLSQFRGSKACQVWLSIIPSIKQRESDQCVTFHSIQPVQSTMDHPKSADGACSSLPVPCPQLPVPLLLQASLHPRTPQLLGSVSSMNNQTELSSHAAPSRGPRWTEAKSIVRVRLRHVCHCPETSARPYLLSFCGL